MEIKSAIALLSEAKEGELVVKILTRSGFTHADMYVYHLSEHDMIVVLGDAPAIMEMHKVKEYTYLGLNDIECIKCRIKPPRSK